KNKLALSALLLTRDASKPALSSSATMESMSPAVTQGVTVYKQGEDLDYHLVIYSAKNPTGKDMSIQIEVVQNDKAVYQGQWSDVEARAIEKDSKGIEVGGSL